MVAAVIKNNTRYVWTDEETATLPELAHKTNINVIQDGNGNKTPPCNKTSLLPYTLLFCSSILMSHKNTLLILINYL